MKKQMSKEDKMRFDSLCNQIIEIACGNFMFRQDSPGRSDPFDTISLLLNMMSEEIEDSCFNPQQLMEHPELYFVIFLDKEYHISAYTPNTPQILQWDKEYRGRPVSEILSNISFKMLKEELRLNRDKNYRRLLFVDFVIKNIKFYRSFCTVQKMIGVDSHISYVMNVFRFKNKEREGGKRRTTARSSNSEKKESTATKSLVKQVRLYILRNLHKELPSLKELGLIHRTNKTKLKEEFKKMYCITIPRFHMQKRLEKGALLIRTTEIPISIISQKCGFKDHSHFSRKFRLQYGKTPSQYRIENFWSSS
ncbi:MAG: AraC family transcriptional regulator [Zunongwangia sp.]|nr:AraC family transcriptional regulator [Zunongwangia sp.]|tara:strand:+ start:809 stop:1732 length:924 start_codon:yes stop_codon:yes gene_type:complete